MNKYHIQVILHPGDIVPGSVPILDYQQEYERAVKQVEQIKEEMDVLMPKDLEERLHKAIAYAANQLVMMGVPRHKLVSKLYEDLNIYTDRHIRNILHEQNVLSEGDEKTEVISKNNSSFDLAIEQENEAFTILAEKMRDLWNSIAVKSRTVHILSKIPKVEVDEYLFLLGKNIENTSSEWDGRQDVSERQFQFLIAATLAGNDKATHLYIKYVKEWKPLTCKQYSKLIHGKARLVPPLYDPKNRQQAVELGFYGVQCSCGSWRVHPSVEPTERMVVHCYACGAEFEAKTEKLQIHPGVIIENTVATHSA